MASSLVGSTLLDHLCSVSYYRLSLSRHQLGTLFVLYIHHEKLSYKLVLTVVVVQLGR